MKIPYSWLKEYIDLDDISVEDVAKKITLSGNEVSSIEKVGGDIAGVVIGKVVSVHKHPDADKLSICKVDIGEENLKPIVCGAANVAENIFVPVATVGSRLPNGMTIKKTSIRGFESDGMLCSKEELGYEEKSDDIWIFENEENNIKVGTPISAVIGTTDYVFEIDVTANRGDLLSVLGVARECSILFDKRITIPGVSAYEDKGGNIDITIENKEGCPRYSARLISDVQIGPSPDWLKRRLLNSGIRSVNNIVDITNYILLEYGQPLHAFDFDKVKDKKIIIRDAKEGEKIVAINGNEVTLKEGVLVIADSEKPIAIAGIMGGKESEITANTKTIMIESAYFNAIKIRMGSKDVGIKSDASYRYERGVDRDGTILALNRAVDLILKLTKSGKILSTVKDIIGMPREKNSVLLDCNIVKKYLSIPLNRIEISALIKRFSFPTSQAGENSLKIDIPSYRHDLSLDVDLVEEIARIYGYNEIATNRPAIKSNPIQTDYHVISKIRHHFASFGLFETKQYSMTDSLMHKKVGFDEKNFIRIEKPISIDMDILRPSTFVSLMYSAIHNQKRRNMNVGLFEIGNVFYKDANGEYVEKKRISVLTYGNIIKKSWNEAERKYDIFDMLGISEYFIKNIMKLEDYEISPKEHFLFVPTESAEIKVSGKTVGIVGMVHPKINKFFDLSGNIYYLDLDVKEIISLSETKHLAYKEMSKYPPLFRDLALVCEKDTPFAQVLETIKNIDKIIKEVCVIDRYEGSQVESGKISIAISVVYSDINKTLSEDEVNVCEEKILSTIKDKFNIVLRS